MKFFLIFLLAACSASKTTSSHPRRAVAQADYLACHTVEEELLIEKVDLSSLPKTYENVKEQVFRQNCAACHFGADSYQPHLDDYQSTLSVINQQSPLQSKLLQAVESGRMPPSYRLEYRDSDAVQYLREWISAGAPRE